LKIFLLFALSASSSSSKGVLVSMNLVATDQERTAFYVAHLRGLLVLVACKVVGWVGWRFFRAVSSRKQRWSECAYVHACLMAYPWMIKNSHLKKTGCGGWESFSSLRRARRIIIKRGEGDCHNRQLLSAEPGPHRKTASCFGWRSDALLAVR
jgi:hypothetical protein